MTLRSATITILLTAIFAVASASASLPSRRTVSKERLPDLQTAAPSGRVIVKFREESRIGVAESGAVSADKTAAGRIAELLGGVAPGCALQRRFRTQAETLDGLRADAEARSGLDLPDLNTYGVLEPGTRDRDALLRIVAELLADPAVETAYLEPVYVPASLGFDAFTGTYTPPDLERRHDSHYAAPDAGDSQDFSTLQGYLGDPPEGVGAMSAAALPGGRGEGVKIVDIELAWLWGHEDLPDPFYTDGSPYNSLDWRNHGTAVLGVVRGADDGSGIRGVAPACQIGSASIYTQFVSEAIIDAALAIDAGDIILIELHAPGPHSTGIGEYGYMPVEFWQDNFDAILFATALGRIVCEAGGNGQQDFDAATYQPLFDPDYRDSGALLCGAAWPDLTPEWYTNYGQRFDLHCWGREVTTCAFGDLQGVDEGLPEERWYTDEFSGTSSSAAIVAGAAADLQGLAKAQLGFVLDPPVVREILTVTGTPYQSSHKHIGPRPNILAAWTLAASSIGNVSGRITDSKSGLPIPYASIGIPGRDMDVSTDAEGLYSINLPGGPTTLEFDEYYYETTSVAADVTPGLDLRCNITLNSLPRITLSGMVAALDTLELEGVRVWVPGKPIQPVHSRMDGAYDLPGLALGKEVAVLYDARPWHGAHVEMITPEDDPSGFNLKYVRLPVAVDTFVSASGYQSFGYQWSWGIPSEGLDFAFTAPSCWAVGLTGDYSNNANARLTSTLYSFPDTEFLELSFHYWCSTESSFDGVCLELLADEGWIQLEPVTGYSHESISALDSRPGWSGSSDGWRGAVFDLSDQNKQAVVFRLVFASDSAVRGRGFFIDDIAFADDTQTVAVEMEPEIPGADAKAELAAHPNPFNPRTDITWRATRPGPVTLGVYDARGRLVRALRDGDTDSRHGKATWQGYDDAGRRAPSGVYLVRMLDSAGATATTRVTLTK